MIWTFHNSQPYQLQTSNFAKSLFLFLQYCSPNIQSFIYCFFVCFTDEPDDGLSQSRKISFENKIQEC